MIFVVLLLPAVGMSVLAVGLATLASRRIDALEATGEDAGPAGVRLPLAAGAAMAASGALLIGLPLLYLAYVMLTAPPFD
jgi:hypothetical protein